MTNKRDESAWNKIQRDLEQSQSVRSLSAGGLPTQAEVRLKKIITDRNSTFSANLSVNEFLCTRSSGYHPIAQVSGSSMFHLGWNSLPIFSSGEMEPITTAHSTMRKLAVSRIQQEARLLKADGIIGVKINHHEYDWGQGLLQFSLIGTAIRILGKEPSTNPFVSTLSGQEFWSLYVSGFYPVGFGYGNSTYYQAGTTQTRYIMGEELNWDTAPVGTGWFNQEVSDFTEAVDLARSLAEIRLQVDLINLRADGMIGVNFERKLKFYQRTPIGDKKRTDMSVFIQITGTGIAQIGDETMPDIDYGAWLT